MSGYLQVFVTVEKREEAERIAGRLLGERLAACVQIIGPVRSTYWWRGNIESSEEWLCLLKTREDLYDDLEETVRNIHSYEVPEILALPIVRGNPDYLKWLTEETRGG
ncbi:MAG: divalent-cation tolerance protein CutA [Deltaproteobacteria bacterium]|nr:divalent-cation tolerance protein CutA [Deltaproteobacteria bacterium]MBW2129753.1 divalent-cation tolerance protein CutA [Deltaproteobacteria bacterium]